MVQLLSHLNGSEAPEDGEMWLQPCGEDVVLTQTSGVRHKR